MAASPNLDNPLPRSGAGKGALLRWAGTLLALGLLVYLLARQGWGEFFAALQSIPAGVFAAAVVLMLVSRLAVCGRWHTLLRSGGARVSAPQTARLAFAGLFASNFLPTTIGGDVVRLAGALQMGLDGGVAAASLVADRLVGMAGMACFLPFGLVKLFASQAGLGAAPVALAAVPLEGRLKPLVEKARRAWGSIVQAFALWLKQPWALGQALGWTLFYQAVLFITNWLLLRAMGQSISIWTVGGLWCLGYFITLLPISINGLGVQEVAITYLFTTYGGVSAPAGLALAILMRMLYLIASLPGAAFLPGLLRPKGAKA